MRSRIPTRRMWTLAAIGLLCVAMAVNLQGCTAVGFAVGAAADAQEGSGGPALLLSVKTGRPVTLTLWDGRSLEGRFAGWSRDTAVAIAAADSIYPRGATVRLATRDGELRIPAERIAKVTISVNSRKFVGLLIGLAADALVISTLRSAWHPTPLGCEGDNLGSPWARVAPAGAPASDRLPGRSVARGSSVWPSSESPAMGFRPRARAGRGGGRG